MVRGYGKNFVALSLGLEGQMPTEFRILRAGFNATTKGPVLFDDDAAALVLAAFDRLGVDLAIDLQHDSIDPAARAMRSDAGDARGWCRLATRPAEVPLPNAASDLWCVDVTWTPDGERRLRERTQRYPSPVVLFDESGLRRAAEIFNVALVSQPATLGAAPLVAAREDSMDPKLVQDALDALIAGDAEAAMGILTQIIAAAAGAGEAASDPPAAVDAAAEHPDPKADEDDEEDSPAAMAAALANVLKVAPRSVALVAEVKRMRAELDALTLSRAADERNERVALVGDLVKLGAELPSTAWADVDKLEPVEHLRTMPIAALRARVAAFASAPRTRNVAPPRGAAAGMAALSDADRARAEKIADPAVRERFVAARMLHTMGSK